MLVKSQLHVKICISGLSSMMSGNAGSILGWFGWQSKSHVLQMPPEPSSLLCMLNAIQRGLICGSTSNARDTCPTCCGHGQAMYITHCFCNCLVAFANPACDKFKKLSASCMMKVCCACAMVCPHPDASNPGCGSICKFHVASRSQEAAEGNQSSMQLAHMFVIDAQGQLPSLVLHDWSTKLST